MGKDNGISKDTEAESVGRGEHGMASKGLHGACSLAEWLRLEVCRPISSWVGFPRESVKHEKRRKPKL